MNLSQEAINRLVIGGIGLAMLVGLLAFAFRYVPLLRQVSAGWDRFWFAPRDPRCLAFMRLAGGLVIFYVHLTYSWGLLQYLGPDAWLDKAQADYMRKDIDIWAFDNDWFDMPVPWSKGNYFWSVFFHVESTGEIIALHVLFLLCMLAFAAGFLTPYSGLLTWLGAMSYVQRATTTVFGLDTMMMILLLYLMIAPSGAVWSVDRWLAERRARARGEEPEPVRPSVFANFATRLIQFHFGYIYIASGTSKLLGATWWGGTALNYVMLNPDFAPMAWAPYYNLMWALAQERWVWEVVVSLSIVATLLIELGLVFLAWDKRWTWLMVCGACGLHFGIAIIMGLTTFSLMMLVLVFAFVPPEALKARVPEIGRKLAWLWTGKKQEPKQERELAGVR
ncbi:MAG: hypothetical protein K2W96_11335 [Gemmataceae bacterium]|nr:hypothetical protein [Gemmataceae bacterium]